MGGHVSPSFRHGTPCLVGKRGKPQSGCRGALPAAQDGDTGMATRLTGRRRLARPSVATVATVAVARGAFGSARPSLCNGHPRRTGTYNASTVVLFRISSASAELAASKTSNPAARSRLAFAERRTAFSSTTKTTDFSGRGTESTTRLKQEDPGGVLLNLLQCLVTSCVIENFSIFGNA